MARENLMNSAHKTSNEVYRREYDRIFRKTQEPERICETCRYARLSSFQDPCPGCFLSLDADFTPTMWQPRE